MKVIIGKNKDGEWGYTLLHRTIVHQGAIFYETREEAQEQGEKAGEVLLQTLYGNENKERKTN